MHIISYKLIKMYKEFKLNLMLAIYSYKIINIYMSNGDKIVIGDGGISKDAVSFRPFGFYTKGQNLARWYSYANIIEIEVYGHES